MICKKCKQEFDVMTNLTHGDSNGDAVEVKTNCGHCGERYYTFTSTTWAQEGLWFRDFREVRANQEGGALN